MTRKTLIIAAMCVGVATGCSSHTSAVSTAQAPISVKQDAGNTAPVGSTLKIWFSDTSATAVTVSAPERISAHDSKAFVTVKAVQGNEGTPGDFSAMDAAGNKLDQLDTGNGQDLLRGGIMVQGEVRSGFVYFPVPDPAMIYLKATDGLHGPDASWKVG